MSNPAPIVNIIRPQLTPDERERRIEDLKRALADFWLEVEKAKRKKGENNEQ